MAWFTFVPLPFPVEIIGSGGEGGADECDEECQCLRECAEPEAFVEGDNPTAYAFLCARLLVGRELFEMAVGRREGVFVGTACVADA